MQSEISISSRGHFAIEQRSEEGKEECTAEQAGDLHVTGRADVRLMGPGLGIALGLNFPSQRIQSKG